MAQDPKVAVKVPRRSGRSKRHHWLGSGKVGTLVPVLVDEVIPGTTVFLRPASNIAMPPLASDAYMKVDYKLEAFFVPMRLLYGGFESWFTDHPYPVISSESYTVTEIKAEMPYLSVSGEDNMALVNLSQPGSLADYLGFKTIDDQLPITGPLKLSMMPFLAYHRIYQDYYRQPSIQKDVFARPRGISELSSSGTYALAAMPYQSYQSTEIIMPIHCDEDGVWDSGFLADGVNIFNLRQRNFGFDYFTNALPSAQLGNEVRVVTDEAGTFTLSQFRSANSLQKFAERNELAGDKFADMIKARYGADLSNGVANRCILLGSLTYDVYNKTVNVTGANVEPAQVGADFTIGAGAQLGRAYAGGVDVLIDNFTANEPGYIFVIGSLVPRASYGTGIRKLLQRYTRGVGSLAEMANPELENTGFEPILQSELVTSKYLDGSNAAVFGYTDRYGSFKTMEDEIHGVFRDDKALAYMAPQRSLTGDVTINSAFLQIPTNYLDNITTVDAGLSQFGYWADFDFDYKVSDCLSDFSLPSLENPAYEHGETIYIHRGGFRL